ncbi:Vacuolar protein sorting-associated protein [Globisporangium polare]
MSLSDDGASATASSAPRKRNQYNLEFKLEVASQYAPGVAGRGFESLAREYGLSKSNVMHWVAKRELIAERLAAAGGGGAARNTFRLDGCGRKSAYSELEDELEQWVTLQTAQGERVKDNDMKEKAIRIYRNMHPDEPADSGESAFKASSGWLARFKQRKNLVLRRPSKAPDGSEEDANSSAVAALVAQQRLVRLEREARAASVASSTAPVASSTTPAVALVAAAAVPANGRKSAVNPASAKRSAAQPAPVPAAQAPSVAPSTAVDPAACVVPNEWMQSVNQQLSSLTQQVAHLVEGQNLLLGMLQRLQPPPIAQPMRVANGVSSSYNSSSPARNGPFLSPHQPQRQPVVVYEIAGASTAGAHEEPYDEDQELPEHHHATPPPAKRRRVSSSILRTT